MGKTVYLTEDELNLLKAMMNDAMSFPDKELDKVRQSIYKKVTK